MISLNVVLTSLQINFQYESIFAWVGAKARLKLSLKSEIEAAKQDSVLREKDSAIVSDEEVFWIRHFPIVLSECFFSIYSTTNATCSCTYHRLCRQPRRRKLESVMKDCEISDVTVEAERC